MLFCTMAPKPPITIDAIEMKMMTCCHCSTMVPNGPVSTRSNSAKAAILGATAKKAVTGVGAPS